ncbi:hypothetical protein [Streptomyces sp. IBSBF 2950]|uniref:hypothetical protein n=1 Tax=Streptomyces sp. IBSBF 2950 TaxID=2903528 RepID=UPI002FDBF0C8
MNRVGSRTEDIACNTKVGYETKSAAKRALKHLRRMPGRSRLEIYPCSFCHGFHLGNPPGFQTYRRIGQPTLNPRRDNAA